MRSARRRPINLVTTLTLLGLREGTSRHYYGPRNTLVMSAGSEHGVQIGQEFFVLWLSSGPLVRR